MYSVPVKATVVVDEDNNWLSYRDDYNVEEAIKQAREAGAYDPTATMYAYKVFEITEVEPEQ